MQNGLIVYYSNPSISLLFFSSEVSALASDLRMRLYQTSAKENLNVCNVFLHLAENYVNQVKSQMMLRAPPPQISIGEKMLLLLLLFSMLFALLLLYCCI